MIPQVRMKLSPDRKLVDNITVSGQYPLVL